MCRARGKTDSTSRVVAESLCFLSVVHAYRPTRDMRVEHSATRPRDLRSFEIRFECDVPIRKFRIGRTCRVPSYHKLRSVTVQQKTLTSPPFVVEICVYVYNSILRVAVLL